MLDAAVAAGGGRLRSVRHSGSYDADTALLGSLAAPGGLYVSDAFRAGFAELAQTDLVFDAWLLEPQLDDLVDLADRFPDVPIVLDHLGSPLGTCAYAGRREERFPVWKQSLRNLAERPNVTVKLGGLGMDLAGFPSFLATPRLSSGQLAAEWRPYIETAIEIFGAERCMFESNYPTEAGCGSYRTIWNAFKRLTGSASDAEKRQLFSATAVRTYKLDWVDLPPLCSVAASDMRTSPWRTATER